MKIDDYLESVSLVDCSGHVTHKLTLLIDGKVRVTIGQAQAVVDPATRTSHPKSTRLARGEYSHEGIINLACEFAQTT